jgi:hypothetical protein
VIRVSAKFAAAACLLFGAALAPRWIADGPARGQDLCHVPAGLKATSLIAGTTPLGERLESLTDETFQWSEGEVPNPLARDLPMGFQIVRSYDGPSLYMNPSRFGSDALVRMALGDEREPTPEERSRLRLQPEALVARPVPVDGASLPVHLAWDHTQPATSRLVAWYFVFDNEAVASPLAAQLADGAALALGGPRPVTLVLISAYAPRARAGVVEDAALAWLADSWRFIAASCAPR